MKGVFVFVTIATLIAISVAFLPRAGIRYDAFYKKYYIRSAGIFGKEVYMKSDSSFYLVRGPFANECLYSWEDVKKVFSKYQYWKQTGH
jgi:hypothetical protein